MATTNYLDLTGLTTYDGLIKNYVDTNVDSVQADVNTLETLVGTIPSGYTSTTIVGYAKELADNVAANGYDDTELSNKVAENEDAISELDGEVGDLTTLTTIEKTTVVSAINELSSGKADKATTIVGYGITDVYTKTEVDTAIANAEHLKRSIVDTLPEVDDADVHTIYMVEITDGSGNQKYEEFMLIDGVFEKIGDSAVDLTNYSTKTEVANAKSEANTYADGLNTAMDARVDALESKIGDGYVAITEDEINALFTV